MCRTSSSSFSSERNSFGEICFERSLPSYPRFAFSAVRRKLVIEMPGTTTGYWKARKMPSRARSSGSNPSMFLPLKSTSPPSIEYPGCPIRAYESVDLPEPFGPITACTSPLLMARVTPFRIGLPSTLACRSRISKSANFAIALLHLISAVCRCLSQPRRPFHRRAKQALVHLLLVLARERGPSGHVLDGAVAVADRQAASGQLDHLGHVPVLGREPGQLADPLVKIQARQPSCVLRLQTRRTLLEESLELLGGEELDQVARQLAVGVGEVLPGGGRERVHVLGPAAAVGLAVGYGREAVGLQALEVPQGRLLGDLEVRGNLPERGVAASFQEGEDDLPAGVHELHPTSFSTSR